MSIFFTLWFFVKNLLMYDIMNFIIFPNNLYQNIELKKYNKIYIVEDRNYFRKNCNKIKLIYLRASMKFYENYLKKLGYNPIYLDIDNLNKVPKTNNYSYDPVNHEIVKKYKLNIVNDNSLFICDNVLLDDFYNKTKDNDNISNSYFFNFMKKHLNIIPDVKSYDTLNRNPIPKNSFNIKNLKYNNFYYKEAIEYVNLKFKNNVGNPENIYFYPITFEDSKKQLKFFINKKLNKFGDYQDAIEENEIFLYHSCISCCLNNGLLNPSYVIEEILKIKNKYKINNVEGFIRQILGWREFMHFIYKYYYNHLKKSNHWQAKNKISKKGWKILYNANTQLSYLNNELTKVNVYAYSHHIIRLMVFLNIFILCQVNPKDIIDWFSDICSIDAYDWVMYSNILCMGYFTTKFMKKPYLATANYPINMGLNVNENDQLIMKSLFYRFLLLNKNNLTLGASIYLRNYTYIEFDKKLQEKYIDIGNKFIKELCGK